MPLFSLLLLWGCECGREPVGAVSPEPPVTGSVTLSIVGTNDLHGHLRDLPLLGGYLANLRAVRAEDGGAVILIDGGDVFQGTLESNLEEGAPIVRAYDELGYDAVTIGNHEFDYGPVGPHATPVHPGDDPRGALRARIAESHFAWLSANLMSREGRSADIAPARTVVVRDGVRIGIVGVTTEDTLTTTISGNVRDLVVLPLAQAIAVEAAHLRDDEHVDVVIVAAHAGGECEHTDDPRDLSSCDAGQEIFEVAAALPEHTVDVIVAGHTHHTVAHFVHGIAIIESYSYGRAFGRVDLTFDRRTRTVTDARIHSPRDLCTERPAPGTDPSACAHGDYEGAPVVVNGAVAAIVNEAVARADEQRRRSLSVTVSETILRDHDQECALGNMFTDLMHDCRPDADIAIYNGGGLRADLPVGPLTYGDFYEALPFDNRFALVRLTGGELAEMITRDASESGSVLSISGARADLRCVDGTLTATLTRDDGRTIGHDEMIEVVVSDFLATGGDGLFHEASGREGGVTIDDGAPMREEMARVLERREGMIGPGTYFDPENPRISLPSARPVRCP